MTNADMYGNTGKSPETELVPGSLRAFRAWTPDTKFNSWVLRSCARNYAWAPGEQIATCLNPVGTTFKRAYKKNTSMGSPGGWVNVSLPGSAASVAVPYTGFSIMEDSYEIVPHRSPDPGCSCGFYAQYSNQNIEYGNHGVSGAIQVSGRVVLGTVGLRAEKAAVEAVYLSDRVMPRRVITVLHEQIPLIYKVPAFLDLEEFQERFPAHDVSELAPKPKPPRMVRYDLTVTSADRANIAILFNDNSRMTFTDVRHMRTAYTVTGVMVSFIDELGLEHRYEGGPDTHFNLNANSVYW